MKSKSKLSNNDNVIENLTEQLRYALNYGKEHNNIELVIKDETRFLESIEALPPEILIQCLRDLIEILKRLGGWNDTIYYGNETIKAEINGWDLLKYRYKELSNSIGKELTANSFFIFYIIASYRLLYYMNPNSRDALYVKLGSILQNDKYSSKFFLQALENLSTKAVAKYKQESGTEPFPVDMKKEKIPTESTPEQRIYSYMYESVREQFKKPKEENEIEDMSIEESLIKATYNEIFSIPISTRNKLIDEHRKHNQKKVDISKNISGDDFETFDTLDDIKNSLQTKDIEQTTDILNWLENIKDPLDKKIAKLGFLENLPIRKIANKLNIGRGKVEYRYNKLKKILPKP